MYVIEELRHELSRVINTLRKRHANTTDAAERKAIKGAIAALNRKIAVLDQAHLLSAATTLTLASQDLERAVAAARLGPFDGYLAALETHLDRLNQLSGAMHAQESLAPAPDDGGESTVRVTRASRGIRRGLEPPIASKDYTLLRKEYQAYFDACTVRPECRGNVAYYIKRLQHGRPVYEAVGRDLNGIPWAFIGAIHAMECGFNFAGHMHNGDPLSARTVQVPKGRPLTGTPPFTWRESAIDALTMKGFHDVRDWSTPHMLYLLERYNGMGYRMRRLVSPYLWSFSNHYARGKFVKDGIYDPHAVSKQCGVAVMLKAVMT
jgi:lysozyme family protein